MTNRQAWAPEKVGRRRDPGRRRLRIYVSWRSGRLGRMVGKVARRPDRREMSARLAPRRFLPLRGACRRPPPDAPRLRIPLILTRNEGEERNARLDAAKAAAPYCQARLTPLGLS